MGTYRIQTFGSDLVPLFIRLCLYLLTFQSLSAESTRTELTLLALSTELTLLVPNYSSNQTIQASYPPRSIELTYVNILITSIYIPRIQAKDLSPVAQPSIKAQL